MPDKPYGEVIKKQTTAIEKYEPIDVDGIPIHPNTFRLIGRKSYLRGFSTAAIGAIFLWALDKFLAIRAMNQSAAHLYLAVLTISAIAGVWILVFQFSYRRRWAVASVLSLIIVIGAVVLERETRPLDISDLPANYRNALAKIVSVTTDKKFPDGEMVAGLPWKTGSVLTTVQFKTVPGIHISNVDLQLSFDGSFIHGAQISSIPNVFLEPKPHDELTDFVAGNLDANGKRTSEVSATPDDLLLVSKYPASTFFFKQPDMGPDIPTVLAFIGGNGYQLGHFTLSQSGASPWYSTSLKITGTYDVKYKDATFTIPVNVEAKKGDQ